MTDLKDKIKEIKALGASQNPEFLPLILHTAKDSDKSKLLEILNNPGITVYDTMRDHLSELIKTRNPGKKYSEEQLSLAVDAHLADIPVENYGVWVYYPWSNRVVHIPDESEFIEIRTSRNLYKITPQERQILSTKKIGVIGLSVGQSVALTLVIERICSEIRLADFDVLELTNLNRIRTGIHNLGLPKVYAAAREIAEIDPFIKVKCFIDGVKEHNLDAFLTDGGNLDLLIEESDGMDIKVLSRLRARELKIPVIMEASDRCMVDVERYDLNPDLGILHGILDNLDLATLKSLKTNEEKIPYMLDIAGIKTASTRIKASMLEIEQTINTWPQLASAVAMGGGVVADVTRRILLNQYTESGRYHIDIEELIGDKKSESKTAEVNYAFTDVVTLTNQLITQNLLKDNTLNNDQIISILQAAILAPSGGNYQPWYWVKKNNALLLYNAMDGNQAFLGYGNYASYVALGASAENAILKAYQMGYKTDLDHYSINGSNEFVTQLSFSPMDAQDSQMLHLAKGIEKRETNRNLGPRVQINPQTLAELKDLVNKTPGAELNFFTNEEELNVMGDILGELEKLRLIEKLGQRDFSDEIRWTPEENEQRRDGLDINTLDFSASEIAGIKIAQQKEVMDLIRDWKGGNAFKKITKKSIDSASAIGVLSVDGEELSDYFKGGQVLERLWILANLKGLAFQPMTSSLYVYLRLLKGNGDGISEEGINTLKILQPEFEKLFNIKRGRAYIMIFRLSITDKEVTRSLRRPLTTCFMNMDQIQ